MAAAELRKGPGHPFYAKLNTAPGSDRLHRQWYLPRIADPQPDTSRKLHLKRG